jgi:hypothetical protein
MRNNWIGRSRSALISASQGPSWGYRRGSMPAVEPTVLACLGLLATLDGPRDPARSLVARAADLLVTVQREDGSLGVGASVPAPGWSTPYALLLWQAIGSYEEPRRKAVDWLLREKVDAPPRPTGIEDGVVAHDTTIRGWPWVEGTHSWVEPSSLGLLAIGRDRGVSHARCSDSVRLLIDRQIESGGWNYGNRAVFGQMLRPQPAPTGLALLALARAGASRSAIERSASYLLGTRPQIGAASSLGWGILGLRAWESRATGLSDRLRASAERAIERDDLATRLGLLLIAVGENALDLLGLSPARSPRP